MTEYRPDLPERPEAAAMRGLNKATADIPLPRRMKRLPVSPTGFVVPWFVAWVDGKPDFRIVREGGHADAYNRGLCWLCGEPRGVYGAFVIGPMCGINRVSSEPPSHRDCAEYAVRACPFLTRPSAVRNERGLEGAQEPGGVMIKRNPGVTLLWVTKSYRPFRVDNGVLFRIGDPTEVRFYAKGLPATRAEVEASVNSGIHLLEEPAKAEGGAAVRELSRLRAQFDKFVVGACPA